MIREAHSGNSQAMGRLLERYRAFLRLAARRELADGMSQRADGSDVVQETFEEACRDFAQFRGSTEPEFSGWLQTIFRRNLANLVRDHQAGRRDVRREQPLADVNATTLIWRQPVAGQSSPSRQAIEGENALRLAAALESLPEDQQEAVRLRHLEGLSLVEIASRLNRTPQAAAGLIKRGLHRLRGLLQDSR
jgi:RNA polymerase sigma-70 factor (ECF subfamily)